MGIGNTRTARAARWRSPAHYPSWGSGTKELQGQARGLTSSSLPLMGIGNSTPSAPRPSRRPRSLPLMGIGNPGPHRARPGPGGAHYPSWGSGTAQATAVRSMLSETHYPSWGSGTAEAAARATTRFRLITPHGDRERSSWEGSTPRSRTTHYPSWGSGTGDLRGLHVPVDSLITPHGDRELEGGPEDGRLGLARSLPLMGIGNTCRFASVSTALTAHYPSWGSGTGPGQRVLQRRALDLITPHGDREQDRRGLHDRDHRHLITPHGDREPSPTPARRWPPATHYPSWGSGTPWASPASRGQSDTHYPSWGSGTLPDTVADAVATCSLPLMGIGNLEPLAREIAHFFSPHYPSWGSGTAAIQEVRTHLELLITPHGDREPVQANSATPPVVPQYSLPLMGIGNWQVEEFDADRHIISLPLMGIGNPPPRPKGTGPLLLTAPRSSEDHSRRVWTALPVVWRRS